MSFNYEAVYNVTSLAKIYTDHTRKYIKNKNNKLYLSVKELNSYLKRINRHTSIKQTGGAIPENIQQDLRILRKLIEQLQALNFSTSKKSDDMIKKLEKEIKELKTLTILPISLEKEKQELNKKIEQLEKEKKNLMDSSPQQIKQLESKLQKLDLEKLQLNNNLLKLNGKIERRNNRIKKLKLLNTERNQTITKLDSQIKSNESEYLKILNALSAKLDTVKSSTHKISAKN